MSFPTYPAYKDSGVEWLGEVPGHWKEKPFFSLVSERCESNAGMKQENLLSLSYGRIVNKDINSLDGLLPASFETYQVVHPGDIVFRLTDLQNDKRSLRSAIVREAGIITSAYLAGVCRGIFPEFANFLFRAYDSIKVFYSMGGGLRQSMKYSDMKWLPIFLPEWQEQTQIARFLDHETARIDALIAEQQRLIELLKEKRQAVISRAFTKGLNPDAPMKDSGIEWLGEVPEHWEVKRLKQLVIDASGIQMGPFGGMLLELDETDTGYKVFGQENTISGNFSSGNRWISEQRYYALLNYHLEVGDIVLTRKGSLGNCRRVSALPQAGIIDSDTIRVRAKEGLISPDYLELLLHEAGYISTQLGLVKRGAILSGLNTEIIANLVIVTPPRDEQEGLLRKVETALSRFDQGITDCDYAVDLLRERRSALISAAVTGKIDVRGWQPPADTGSASTGRRLRRD